MIYKVVCFSFVLLITTTTFSFVEKAGSNEKGPNWQSLSLENLNSLVSLSEFSTFSREEMEHMRWVAKASYFLRGRKPLSFETDDIEALKAMSKEEVVDHFLESDLFYNSLLDFSLYFIGFQADELVKWNGHLSHDVFAYSQAIDFVKSIANGGTDDSLFSDKSYKYIPPLGPVISNVSQDLKLPEEFKGLKTDIAKRNFIFDYAISTSKSVENMTFDEAKTHEKKLCSLYFGIYNTFTIFDKSPVEKMGFVPSFVENLKSRFHSTEVVNSPYFCNFSIEDGKTLTFELILEPSEFDVLKSFAAASLTYFEELKRIGFKYDSQNYLPKIPQEIVNLDENLYGKALHFTNDKVSRQLQNSSTNMNRKRGAYILKRFFCDDLTPVNVEIPDQHAGGVHGSNPSCYACHYKLDPMAGFFKDFGFSFLNFSGQEQIFFDDFASQNLGDYQTQWLKHDSPIKWNIGYVRSPTQENLNIYGESLTDLNNILRTSPEVKRCMVKRLLEFSTDPNQLFDPGYIDELTSQYRQDNKVSSKAALKKLYKSVALNKSFSEDNRIYNQCYDLGPNLSLDGPPCEVAHIVETSCKKCHDSVYGLSSLDFSQWIEVSEGVFGFAHINESTGKQYAPHETFAMMLDRITTSDKSKRMPKGPDMDPIFRQTLFKWLSEEIH